MEQLELFEKEKDLELNDFLQGVEVTSKEIRADQQKIADAFQVIFNRS